MTKTNSQKKYQILLVHGGMTFKNNADYQKYLKTRNISIDTKIRWSDQYLTKSLGKNFQIIRPRMPLADNAKYADWKTAFERYIPLLTKDIILMGNSLGGIFLAKYLSENRLKLKRSQKLVAVYLTCPPFDNTLPGEDLVGGFNFTNKSNFEQLDNCAQSVNLLFSKDDDVVPVSHAKKFAAKLKKAKIIILNNVEGHFKVSKLPLIIKLIKKDTAN